MTVGCMVFLDRDSRFDPTPAQAGAVGFRAVGLVSQDPVGPGGGPAGSGTGNSDAGQHRGELGAIAALPGGEQDRQRLLALLAAQAQLAAARAPQRVIGRLGLDPAGRLGLQIPFCRRRRRADAPG